MGRLFCSPPRRFDYQSMFGHVFTSCWGMIMRLFSFTQKLGWWVTFSLSTTPLLLFSQICPHTLITNGLLRPQHINSSSNARGMTSEHCCEKLLKLLLGKTNADANLTPNNQLLRKVLHCLFVWKSDVTCACLSVYGPTGGQIQCCAESNPHSQTPYETCY